MGTTLNRHAYQRLVDEDLEWLLKQPRSLEREHIEGIVRQSPDLYYRADKEPTPPNQHSYVPLRGDVGTWCGYTKDGGMTCGLSATAEIHQSATPLPDAIAEEGDKTLGEAGKELSTVSTESPRPALADSVPLLLNQLLIFGVEDLARANGWMDAAEQRKLADYIADKVGLIRAAYESQLMPLCPVHQSIDDRGRLEVTYGNHCVACSLNERLGLLDILSEHIVAGPLTDSVSFLRGLLEHHPKFSQRTESPVSGAVSDETPESSLPHNPDIASAIAATKRDLVAKVKQRAEENLQGAGWTLYDVASELEKES